MSLVLRHAPPDIGIAPDPFGWVEIETLVSASDGVLSAQALRRIVEQSDKQRFALSEDGRRVRANQGHSIEVDVGLVARKPPEVLFHGTATLTATAIRDEGLKPMSRQYVHLSSDAETARKVGMRHGKPAILPILAGDMHSAGHVFYLSDNQVWLTRAVPAHFLKGPE